MEKSTTLYFMRVVKILVHSEEFKGIETELSLLPEKHRKAFWNLLLVGFSTKLAFRNCKNLYELAKSNKVGHAEMLRLILLIDTELKFGIYTKEMELFESN